VLYDRAGLWSSRASTRPSKLPSTRSFSHTAVLLRHKRSVYPGLFLVSACLVPASGATRSNPRHQFHSPNAYR
jgi:hypothetical protein